MDMRPKSRSAAPQGRPLKTIALACAILGATADFIGAHSAARANTLVIATNSPDIGDSPISRNVEEGIPVASAPGDFGGPSAFPTEVALALGESQDQETRLRTVLARMGFPDFAGCSHDVVSGSGPICNAGEGSSANSADATAWPTAGVEGCEYCALAVAGQSRLSAEQINDALLFFFDGYRYIRLHIDPKTGLILNPLTSRTSTYESVSFDPRTARILHFLSAALPPSETKQSPATDCSNCQTSAGAMETKQPGLLYEIGGATGLLRIGLLVVGIVAVLVGGKWLRRLNRRRRGWRRRRRNYYRSRSRHRIAAFPQSSQPKASS